MSILVNVVLPVFLVTGTAALMKPRLGIDVQSISRLAFYLFSPALIFTSLATSNVSGTEFIQIALTLTLLTLLM